MVEKIIINPDDVRAYGNIFEEKKREEFRALGMVNVVSLGNQTVNGETHEVFSVKRTDTSLTASNYTGYVGTGSLSATLKNDNNQGISSETVTLKVNNSTLEATTNSSGVASFNLSSLPAGTYTGYLKYAGSLAYDSCDKQVSITVNKYATTLAMTSANNNLYPTEANAFTFTLRSNNVGLNNKSIDIYDGNTLVKTVTTDSNGVATWNLSWANEGTKTVKAVFEGDDTYLGQTSNSINITVAKITTTLSCSFSKTSLYPTEQTTVTVTLKDSSNNGISGATVKLYEGNTVKTTLTTNSSGVATSTFSYNTEGTRTLKAVFEGTTVYKNVTSSSTNVTATKKATTLTITSSGGYVDSNSFSLKLTTDNNAPVSGATIACTLRNKSTSATKNKTVTTNSSGVASFNMNSQLAYGEYYLIAVASASTVYEGTGVNGEFTINRYATTTTLSVNNLIPLSGETITGTVTLKDHNNNGMSGYTVGIYSAPLLNPNDKTLLGTVTTNNSGVGTYQWGFANEGSYIVTGAFDGNDLYAPSTVSIGAGIVVGKHDVEIQAESFDITKSYYETGHLTVRLWNASAEEAIANATVKLEYYSNGSWYSSGSAQTTDSNGYATLNQPGRSTNAGTYPLRVVYEGSNSLKSATETGTLTVNPAPTRIVCDSSVSVYQGSSSISVNAQYYNGSSWENPAGTSMNPAITVRFKREGISGATTVRTNSRGIATCNTSNWNVGTYTVNIDCIARDQYASSSNSMTVTVHPEWEITGRIITVIQSSAIIEFTVTHNGTPMEDIPLTITYPNGNTTTIDTDSDGQVSIENANVRGEYVATYNNVSGTVTY